MLADVFENFRNMCPEIYELDLAKLLSSPGLTCQTALKKTKVKLNLLTDIYVINGKKGVRGGMCHFVYRYAKANMQKLRTNK